MPKCPFPWLTSEMCAAPADPPRSRWCRPRRGVARACRPSRSRVVAYRRLPDRVVASRPAMPARTHGTGSSQRTSVPSTRSLWMIAQTPTRPRKAMPITRCPMFTGWRPCGRTCSWRAVLIVLCLHGDLADAQLGVDADVGGGRARRRAAASCRCRCRRVLAEEGDVARAADLARRRRRPCRRARSPRSGRRRPRCRWSARRGSARSATWVRSMVSSPAPKSYLSCDRGRGVRASRSRSVPSHLSAAVAPARPTVGEQAQQDQPAGPAVERADQQHHAGDRRRPGRGTPRRRPARRPRRGVPRTPSPSAISARVNQNRIGPRRRGSRGAWRWTGAAGRAAAVRRSGLGVRRGGVAGVARVGRRVPLLRLRGVLAPARRVLRPGGSGPGGVLPVLAGDEEQHHQRDDRQRPREPEDAPRVADQRERGDRADDQQRHGAAPLVEGDGASPVSSSGTSSQQAPYRIRPAPPKKDEHHERDPQDERVDVEVASQAAGDAGHLAVGGGAPQPAEVAHLVARHSRAAVAGVSGRRAGGMLRVVSWSCHKPVPSAAAPHHRGTP